MCDGRAKVTKLDDLGSDEIAEASGIVASRTNPGIWWINNDSGDSPRVFAVDVRGRLRMTLNISGADTVDWEDIAVNGDTIYISDTGDNRAKRSDVVVYSVAEPVIADETSTEDAPVTAQRLTLTYPDGPHDAEALAFDPSSGYLYLITKDWSLSGDSVVYRTPALFADGESRTLEKVGDLNLPVGHLVTGADISPDGSLIAVRTYTSIELFRRSAGESVEEALRSDSCRGPLVAESQGESIGFSADGASYMTVSEGPRSTLHLTHG